MPLIPIVPVLFTDLHKNIRCRLFDEQWSNRAYINQSTIETRVVKVGDFVIIKEEYILYKGNPFEHVFIFLSINVSST